ncbi:type II/IV secretion system ATP hydrolase tadA/virB11/cpaF [Vibrio sp. JCM 19236]|nr:type II/IV secretion system ATP hydrolase tadA/virB11/cpaF [Vibrio sp. JCM 19236]
MSSNKELYLAFRSQIFEAMDVEAAQQMSQVELESQFRNAVEMLASNYGQPITGLMKTGLVKSLIDEIFGLGPLQPLVEDQSITDIMVNGPERIFMNVMDESKSRKLVR